MNYYFSGKALVATQGELKLPRISESEYAERKKKVDERIEGRINAREKHRPLTESEVMGMLLRAQVNTLEVDDQTAYRMREFYPEWAADTTYPVGHKVRHNGKLWKTIQAHTSQTGWEPENAASLWEGINETHDGTLYDPIPYEGNMALTAGLYYVQGGKVYLCTRDTGNPVHNALSELVGLFVESVA